MIIPQDVHLVGSELISNEASILGYSLQTVRGWSTNTTCPVHKQMDSGLHRGILMERLVNRLQDIVNTRAYLIPSSIVD